MGWFRYATQERRNKYRFWLRGNYEELMIDAEHEEIPDNIPENMWNGAFEKQREWNIRQRANPLIKPYDFGWDADPSIDYAHAFQDWYDEYYDDHPDWFAQPPEGELHEALPAGDRAKLNKPNPEVQDAVFDDWYEDWQGNQALTRTLNASPNDSRFHCTRETSREWDDGRNEGLTDNEIWNSDDAIVTERFVRFWNILADQVAEVDPDAWVTAYAYRNYQEPPIHNDVRSNVAIGYVGGEAYYPDEDHIYDEWRAWSNAGAQLFWRPNMLAGGHGMPHVFHTHLGEDLQQFYEQDMIGYVFDGFDGNWATQGVNYYVVGERLWRPDDSIEEIMEEYYAAFGEAADAVQEYFEYWEELTTSEGVAHVRDFAARESWGAWRPAFIELIPRLYTEDVLNETESILERAEDAVADEKEVYQDRVAFLRHGFEHVKLTAGAVSDVFEFRENPTAANKETARESTDELLAFRFGDQDSPRFDRQTQSLATNYYRLTWAELNHFDLWEFEGIPIREEDYSIGEQTLTVDGDASELPDTPTLTLADSFSVFRGDPTVSGDVWFTYDSGNLFLTADIDDDQHTQENPTSSLWGGDLIQFAEAPAEADSDDDWSLFSIGLNPDGSQVYNVRTDSLAEEVDIEIVRNEEANQTVYELGFPWEVLAADPNDEFVGLELAIGDWDGDEESGLLEWGQGIFGGRNPARFNQVRFD